MDTITFGHLISKQLYSSLSSNVWIACHLNKITQSNHQCFASRSSLINPHDQFETAWLQLHLSIETGWIRVSSLWRPLVDSRVIGSCLRHHREQFFGFCCSRSSHLQPLLKKYHHHDNRLCNPPFDGTLGCWGQSALVCLSFKPSHTRWQSSRPVIDTAHGNLLRRPQPCQSQLAILPKSPHLT